MNRVIIILLTLACGLQAGAQDVYYEMWIDSYRAGLQRGVLSEGEQTVTFDATVIPTPGLHFLNILPYSQQGELGKWSQLAFLMPEGWPDSHEGKYVEYWIDDNLRLKARRNITEAEQSFSIDVGAMTPGLHFLSFRTLNSRGEPGQWKRMAFLMPEGWPDDGVTLVEYWIDDNRQLGARKAYTGPDQSYSFDISGMTYGLHFLSFRTINSRGEAGGWKRMAFYINNHSFDRQPLSFQYWIDNGEPIVGHGYTPSEIPLSLSTDDLSLGKHTFSYRMCYSENPDAEDAEFGDTETVTFDYSPEPGDVNFDGVVDQEDVNRVANHILGQSPEDFVKSAADVNQDGKINAADIVEIVDIIKKSEE